jgi:glycosyltransferase involved in cell wall biosynthesis
MNPFNDWTVVSFNDDTGLGSMAKEIKTTLGIKRHLVCKSKKLTTKSINPIYELLFDNDTQSCELINFLQNTKGIICFEYVDWHKGLLSICNKLNLKIVCIPMWEWFRGTDEIWKSVDLFLCPNKKALQIVHSYGFQNASHISWALDLARLPKRQIKGYGNHFVHNAGIVDNDDRKGTFATIKAFTKVRNPDITLSVRIQKETQLPKFEDPRIKVEVGNFSLDHLYQIGDVAIQPSKMEGLGFMVLEPVCCGIPVITNNISPINEYGSSLNLRLRTKWFNRNSFAKVVAKIKHAYMREPSVANITKAIEWCTTNPVTEISVDNRKWAEKKFNPTLLRTEWSTILNSL